MEIGPLIEAIVKLGLVPVLLVLVLLWYKERTDKTIQYLEKQNETLLNTLLQRRNQDVHRNA